MKLPIRQDYFHKIFSARQSFLLGFLFAKGHITSYYICFEISKYLEPVIDQLLDILYIDQKPKKTYNGKYVSIWITNHQVCTDLAHWNLNTHNQSKISRIQLPALHPSLYIPFIQGYFIGNRSHLRANKLFLESIQPYVAGKTKIIKVCGLNNYQIVPIGKGNSNFIKMICNYNQSIQLDYQKDGDEVYPYNITGCAFLQYDRNYPYL